MSDNPRFCASALARYPPADFVAMVDASGIAHHEKTAGQLFCDGSAQQITDILLRNCDKAGVVFRLGVTIGEVVRTKSGFTVDTSAGRHTAGALVIATGGKSIPKLGATGFGYRIAEQFGHAIIKPRPGLVPLTFGEAILSETRTLAGVSVDASVRHGKTVFDDGLVFTHRGLSGPSILQISSYWRDGDEIVVSLAPGTDIYGELSAAKDGNGRQSAANALSAVLPKRLAKLIAGRCDAAGPLSNLSEKKAARPRRGRQSLARQAGRQRRLPHRGGDTWRRRYDGSQFAQHGIQSTCPDFISSAKSSTSPAGSAATISNGPGRPAGPPDSRSRFPLHGRKRKVKCGSWRHRY